MPQLFCILEDGGRALLTRAQGDIQTPSFPTVGLLSSIATYSQNAGYELQSMGSSNVRIVYRRFDNHLLLVLVTSNLLLQTELLQLHLHAIYDTLVFLLGHPTLCIETSAQIDALRKKLRGVQQAVDSLIADDMLAPCVLLPVPQIVGLSLRDRATLQAFLGRAAATLGAGHAALVRSGYYLAGTPGWWAQLCSAELLVLQHLSAQQGQAPMDMSSLVVYPQRRQGSAMRLQAFPIDEGLQLLVLSEMSDPQPGRDAAAIATTLFLQARHIIQTPLWLAPPVPQFSTIPFDLALVLERSPACITLLWGYSGAQQQGSGAAPQGFNPHASPTLRKELGRGGSPDRKQQLNRASMTRGDNASGHDNLQLYFKSAVDTLVSFVLQSWPHMPLPAQAALHQLRPAPAGPPGIPIAQAAQQGQPAATASTAFGSPMSPSRLGGNGSAPGSPAAPRGKQPSQLAVPAGPAHGGAGGLDTPRAGDELGSGAYEEVHVVVESMRLVALMERAQDGLDVFLAFPKRMTRRAALEAAVTLRATFMISYRSEPD